MNDVLNNKEPLNYSPYQLNILISMLLSELTEDNSISYREGEFVKSVFNSLMELVVEEKELADEMIAIGDAVSEELSSIEEYDLKEDEWDIVSAAEKIRDDSLMN